MKKNLTLLTLIAVLLSVFAVKASAEEINFNDLTESHWAYGQIQQLVSEGIINGYEDNTFRPEDTVTRAEFAKIFGKGRKIKPADFLDLPRVHWAYSYVMTSGMDIDQDRFYPDRALTRAEALKALFDRYGDKGEYFAPSVITNQYKDKKAVAWAYSKKLMVGDDGINLRLNDTITRAEAVALVLRARTVKDAPTFSFAELANGDVLEKLYNYCPVFSGIPYSENGSITNGQFADIIVKIVGYDIENNNQYKPAYDGKYALQIAYVTSSAWGKENNNSAFENEKLTTKNAVTGLVFAATMKAHNMLSVSGNNGLYTDVTTNSPIEKSFLVYAYENGIFITKDGTLNPDKEITLKELMCYYILTDNTVGFEESFNGALKNESLNLNYYGYPGNYENYSAVLESVPVDVYENAGIGNTREDTTVVNEYSDVFRDLLVQVKGQIKPLLPNARVTYYPTLVSVENNNVMMVLRLDVEENSTNITYSQIFNNMKTEDEVVKQGTAYLVVSTNTPLVYGFESENLSLDKIL